MVLTKALLNVRVHYINVYTHINVPTLEATAPTVFTVWLQAYIQKKHKVKSNNLAYINIGGGARSGTVG